MLYVPAPHRKTWGEFREHVDNSGLRVCNVILDLVSEYMAGSSRTSRDSAKVTQ